MNAFGTKHYNYPPKELGGKIINDLQKQLIIQQRCNKEFNDPQQDNLKHTFYLKKDLKIDLFDPEKLDQVLNALKESLTTLDEYALFDHNFGHIHQGGPGFHTKNQFFTKWQDHLTLTIHILAFTPENLNKIDFQKWLNKFNEHHFDFENLAGNKKATVAAFEVSDLKNDTYHEFISEKEGKRIKSLYKV